MARPRPIPRRFGRKALQQSERFHPLGGLFDVALILQFGSVPTHSGRRYKLKSKGVVVLPDDLASAVDFTVAGQDQKEFVSADAAIDLSVRAELPTGFRDIVKPALNRPGTVGGNRRTSDLVIEGYTLIVSLVALGHIENCRPADL